MNYLDTLLDPCIKTAMLDSIRDASKHAHHPECNEELIIGIDRFLITPLETYIEADYQRIGYKTNAISTVIQTGMALIDAAEEIRYKLKYLEIIHPSEIDTLDSCWKDFQIEIGWGKALDVEKNRQAQSKRAQNSRSIYPRLVADLIKKHPPKTLSKELWVEFFAMLENRCYHPREAPGYNKRNSETWAYIIEVYDDQKNKHDEKLLKFSRFKNLVSETNKKLSR